jgi:hypothetical protein
MKITEQEMTGKESIRIITDMILKTKANIRQGSFHLLFWGWLIVFCAFAEFLLYELTTYDHPYYVWFLTIPGVVVSLIYGFTRDRKALFHTYADRLYMWTWFSFGFTAIVLFILLGKNMISVTPFILMLAGLPTFMSGIILKFRPLIIGGVIFWLCAVLTNYSGESADSLIMAGAVIAGYLIPGYLLKKRASNE